MACGGRSDNDIKTLKLCDNVGGVLNCPGGGGGRGVFRVVKRRCAGKGDAVKEDPVEAKKGVKWADWRPETVRIIKWTIILIRPVCCWGSFL